MAVDNKQKFQYRINEAIRVKEVRLVGDNVEQGVYTIQQALRIANDQELDLVEISPNVNPPVCRVVDYQKFIFQLKKKQKEQKAKSVKVVVKEIRFGLRPMTTTTTSSSSTLRASSAKARRSRLTSSSVVDPSSSRIRVKCSSCASL